jgi:hypothetical protein
VDNKVDTKTTTGVDTGYIPVEFPKAMYKTFDKETKTPEGAVVMRPANDREHQQEMEADGWSEDPGGEAKTHKAPVHQNAPSVHQGTPAVQPATGNRPNKA